MRKFLKLIQESDPGISYIIDIKDTDGTLLGSAAIPGPTNTSFYEEFASYLKNVHAAEVVGVNPRLPAEDQEAGSAIDLLAMQGNPEAEATVRDREAVTSQIIKQERDLVNVLKSANAS
jgi:hypothetical protein